MSVAATPAFEYLMANGGSQWHIVPATKNKALCGFEPSSPRRDYSRVMKPRGRWRSKATEIPTRAVCRKCKERAAKESPVVCCESSHVPRDTACRSFLAGKNGRCVYCDHENKCHPGPGATCEIGSGEFGDADISEHWYDEAAKATRGDNKP